jgi:circadian clock protein KaiC
MRAQKRKKKDIISTSKLLVKCPTGIRGLDEITAGGLPQGRTTLVCGGPGCGKTLFGMEFLMHGALDFNEPGVCISFEETAEELTTNVASLGFDVEKLIKRKLLSIDYVFMERSQIQETGEWDLEALFLRLGYAIDSVGAKRVLLDSIESLFATLSNESLLRSELRRLFRWLKDRGLTAVVTAERGEGALTRHGLEEYISDCVILLDNRVHESVVTRRMRVVKYRGSTHGANEYPFLIDRHGFSILPLTSLELNSAASEQRVSTGIEELDQMLGGKGYFRGSAILISGTAGTGKTSLASHFVEAACARGERCIYFSFEESAQQVARNMQSIGVNLGQWLEKGLLRFSATRPTTLSLEMHLVRMHSEVEEFQPDIVVIDPVTALLEAGTQAETRSMLLRVMDFFKVKGITIAMTTLTSGESAIEQTSVAISSLVDVWLLLRDIESEGERNRGLYVIKARGLAHSNQIREFLLTSRGVRLRDVYLGAEGIRTGSARVAQEARDALQALAATQEVDRQRLVKERRRRAIEAQIAALQLDLETEDQQSDQIISQGEFSLKRLAQSRTAIAESRSLNVGAATGNGGIGNGGGGKVRGGRK